MVVDPAHAIRIGVRQLTMTSDRHPSSLSRVDAVARNPCDVISRLLNPRRVRAMLSALPAMGCAGFLWAGKR
jgi:hypothetical protein